MLLDIIKKGATDKSVTVRIIDSTDGTPETAVAYNTSGIDMWYRREGAAKTSLTEASLSALTDAHSDGGILHVGDGYYRLDLPDAAFATGASYVDVGGAVTGMIVIGGRVKLDNPGPLAKNVALPNFPFTILDSTTDAPATGKTVSVYRSIDGGAYSLVGTATETSNGNYEIDFSASDMNGRTIAVRCTASGCHDKNFAIVTDAD